MKGYITMSVSFVTEQSRAEKKSSAPNGKLNPRELNVADRCDACGAQAYVRAGKAKYTNELLFCRHHYLKCEAGLISSGFTIDDQTSKLFKNTKPMSGSNLAD